MTADRGGRLQGLAQLLELDEINNVVGWHSRLWHKYDTIIYIMSELFIVKSINISPQQFQKVIYRWCGITRIIRRLKSVFNISVLSPV